MRNDPMVNGQDGTDPAHREPGEGGKDRVRDAWAEVGERFGEVGRRVSERYRTLEGERAPIAEAPTEPESQTRLRAAVDGVIRELDQAFTSVGDAFRDPEDRERIDSAVRSLGRALSATFDQATRRIRRSS